MCLGRVKGTRVATSAAGQTEETAGCNEERAEGGREGDALGGWMHLRVTRVLSRRIPFSGSFPTRGRFGGREAAFWNREFAASPVFPPGESWNPESVRSLVESARRIRGR